MLQNTISNELHKKVINHFRTRKVITKYADEIWGADIVEMQEWAESNDNNRYILTVIDTFSKFAWAEPLKDKTAKKVLEAFKTIVQTSKRKPVKLWVDQGKEFDNKEFSTYCKDNKISMYSTFGSSKSAIIERFNRTLKTAMWRYFTANNTRRWVDVLPELMTRYNNARHRTIKMTPKEASKPSNHFDVYHNIYFEYFRTLPNTRKPKFAVGDNVRLSRIKDTFEKGFHANWTREVFKISEVLKTNPITYRLDEWNGDPVLGTFYEQQLQKTEEPEYWEVEKIIKHDKRQKKSLVKFLGWDDRYNLWVDNKDLKDVN